MDLGIKNTINVQYKNVYYRNIKYYIVETCCKKHKAQHTATEENNKYIHEDRLLILLTFI